MEFLLLNMGSVFCHLYIQVLMPTVGLKRVLHNRSSSFLESSQVPPSSVLLFYNYTFWNTTSALPLTRSN